MFIVEMCILELEVTLIFKINTYLHPVKTI